MAYGDDALDTIIQQMHNGNARLAGSTAPPTWGTTPPLPAQPVPGAPPATPGFFSDAEALQRAARIRAAGAPVAAPTMIAPNPAVAAAPAVAADAAGLGTDAAAAAIGAGAADVAPAVARGLGARMLGGAAGGLPGLAASVLAVPALGYLAGQSNPNYSPNLPTGFANTAGGAATGVQLPVRTGYAGNVPPPPAGGTTLSALIARSMPAISYDARQQVAQNQRELDRVSPVGISAPAINPTVTTAPEDTPYQRSVDAALRVQGASDLYRGIDSAIGPGGTPDGANARIRGFGARPDLVNSFNAAQAVSGTGVQVLRSPTGGLTFTDGPNAFPKQYTKPDGTATTNYNESEQFISGTARAAAEKAQLAKIEGDRDLDVLKQQIAANPTRNGKTLLLQQYLGELQSRSADRTLAATVGNNQAKLGIDTSKLLLDAAKTQAEIKDKSGTGALSTLKLNMALSMLGKGDTAGAAALLGARANPGEKFVADPNELVKPGQGTRNIIGNQGTVKTARVLPAPPTEADITATMTAQGMTREAVLARLRAEGRL